MEAIHHGQQLFCFSLVDLSVKSLKATNFPTNPQLSQSRRKGWWDGHCQEEGKVFAHCNETCVGRGDFWLGLTEDSSRGIVTGETGLAHTRATYKASVRDSAIEARGENNGENNGIRAGIRGRWSGQRLGFTCVVAVDRGMMESGPRDRGMVDEEPKHSQTSSPRE